MEGLALGPDGTVYVADWSNSQIDLFSSSGVYQTALTGLTEPTCVAVNSAGTTLYVLEWNPAAVLTYSITNGTPKTFTSTGSFSLTGTGSLSIPELMCLDSSNNVYVANYNQGDLVRYAPDGSNPVSFGNLYLPTGIVVDGHGNVLATGDDGYIQEYYPSGSGYVAGVTFGNGMNAPKGLALDASGNLYAANYGGHQILEFPKF